LRLRVDPWDPEYGASLEVAQELGPPVGLDLDVEQDGPWSPVEAPAAATPLPCCAFIDGVRRVEAQLHAEQDDQRSPGLAGSFAVGCAWSTRPPAVSDVLVGRCVVIGGGLTPTAMDVTIGTQVLAFEPHSVAGTAPLDPLQGLQNLMRDAEATLARTTVEAEGADLVVCDGPLGYFWAGPIVGMVKRQSRSYLDAARVQVIPQLQVGERTPIFKLGEQRLERYSWYLRLAQPRAIDAPMAGVVRLEVAADAGLPAAQALAALAGSVLPQFASKPGHDARAPQNLYPIGALEATLRHRLGDPRLIRRGIEFRLLKEVA
jgi:hypothetical protein